MNEESKKVFKTRAFGGFDKDDVLNYIEATAQKMKGEMNSLKKEMETREKEKKECLSQNTELSEQIASLKQENEQKDEVITNLKDELQEANDTIAKLRMEVSQYDKMKADIAGIELAAHGRAKEIEQESLEMFDRIRNDTEQLLQAAKERFLGFANNIGEQVSQAETTLDSAKNEYKSLLAGLSGLKERLYGLKTDESHALGMESKQEPREKGNKINPERERNEGELYHPYIEEIPDEAKRLSLKELMDRLKCK